MSYCHMFSAVLVQKKTNGVLGFWQCRQSNKGWLLFNSSITVWRKSNKRNQTINWQARLFTDVNSSFSIFHNNKHKWINKILAEENSPRSSLCVFQNKPKFVWKCLILLVLSSSSIKWDRNVSHKRCHRDLICQLVYGKVLWKPQVTLSNVRYC